MRRTVLILVLSLAAMTAAESVLHAHSLTREPSGSCSVGAQTQIRCSICSTATARVLLEVPELVAPVCIASAHPTLVAHVAPESAVPVLSPRAPPAL